VRTWIIALLAASLTAGPVSAADPAAPSPAPLPADAPRPAPAAKKKVRKSAPKKKARKAAKAKPSKKAQPTVKKTIEVLPIDDIEPAAQADSQRPEPADAQDIDLSQPDLNVEESPEPAVEKPAPLKAKPAPAAAPPAKPKAPRKEAPAAAAMPPEPPLHIDIQPARSDAPPRRPDEAGLLGEPSETGLSVSQVYAQSFAESLGMKAGDKILRFEGKPLRTAALPAPPDPVSRLSAVVQRGREVLGLRTPLEAPAKAAARDPKKLTALEERVRADHLEEAERHVPDTLKTLKAPSFRIAAGESLWVRFPKGLPRSITGGDVLEGVTSTPMAMDASLDYLAIPQGSKVWAQAVSVKEAGPSATAVRLRVYKIAVAGGHTYPCEARISEVSGAESLLKLSKGGVLVAAPADTDPFLADPDRNYKIRLAKPLTLSENQGFFKAGVGLWFKTSDGAAKGRTFEITHVIEKRAAEAAELKPGDRITAIEGRASDRYSFQEAISLLYGKPGSSVDIRVMRSGASKAETLSLRRGMMFRQGIGLTVRKEGDNVLVKKILPESPSAKARLKEGDLLLRLGDDEAASLTESELRAKLREDLTGSNAATFQTPGQAPRRVPLTRASFATPIEPNLFGEEKK